MVLKEGPRAHILVPVLHALFPVRAVRSRSHAPLRCAVSINHGQAWLDHVGGKRGVPKDLLGDLALCRHRTGFTKGHANGFLGRVLLHPVDVLGQGIDGRRRVGSAATGHGCTLRCTAVGRGSDAPFVNWLAIRNANICRTSHGQPGIGEAPAQRWVLLAVVHMAIDRLAVDVLHVIREEFGDVFVSAPVQRHTQVVAKLGFELVLQVLAVKQVGAEPVQVGELLVRQLVQLAIGRGGEAGANKVLDIETRVGPLFACAGHVVGQVKNLAVAVVGADQV